MWFLFFWKSFSPCAEKSAWGLVLKWPHMHNTGLLFSFNHNFLFFPITGWENIYWNALHKRLSRKWNPIFNSSCPMLAIFTQSSEPDFYHKYSLVWTLIPWTDACLFFFSLSSYFLWLIVCVREKRELSFYIFSCNSIKRIWNQHWGW